MPKNKIQSALRPLLPTADQPADKPAGRGFRQTSRLSGKEINDFFRTPDDKGRPVGSQKCGIYAFYDFDGEPIYVGQTFEGLSSRIGRHLTNRRTDAVAMNVLDPFEVAEIRVWPLDLSQLSDAEQRDYLDRAGVHRFSKRRS